MTITPGELLDTSIAQLQTLAAFLADQLSDQHPDEGASLACAENRVCREVLTSLGVLIHKLRAARPATPPARRQESLHASPERPGSSRESAQSARPAAQRASDNPEHSAGPIRLS
jgi:hypothetical protein